MPIVKIYTSQKFTGSTKLLMYCCEEIIPAALSSKQGPLHPSDTTVMIFEATEGLNVDVFIDVEAYKYDDRLINKEARAKEIALGIEEAHKTFPSPYNEPFSMKIWLKLTDSGYFNNQPQEDKPMVDMSINAAIKRITANIGFR